MSIRPQPNAPIAPAIRRKGWKIFNLPAIAEPAVVARAVARIEGIILIPLLTGVSPWIAWKYMGSRYWSAILPALRLSLC